MLWKWKRTVAGETSAWTSVWFVAQLWWSWFIRFGAAIQNVDVCIIHWCDLLWTMSKKIQECQFSKTNYKWPQCQEPTVLKVGQIWYIYLIFLSHFCLFPHSLKALAASLTACSRSHSNVRWYLMPFPSWYLLWSALHFYIEFRRWRSCPNFTINCLRS